MNSIYRRINLLLSQVDCMMVNNRKMFYYMQRTILNKKIMISGIIYIKYMHNVFIILEALYRGL